MKRLIYLSVCLILTMGCEDKSSINKPPIDQEKYDFLAFQNVNLVPMTTEKIIPDQTVLIQKGTIASIGTVETTEIPDNTLVIDGTGKYLMPGLADMHIHTTHAWQTADWPVSPMKLFLVNGVTTVRDFGPKGHFKDYTPYWNQTIQKGRLVGPTIYGCGGIMYSPVEEPEKEVVRQHEKGFHFIKPYSFVSKSEYDTIISTAKRLGIYVAGHIPFRVGLDGVLKSEMNEIAHIEELAWEFIEFDKNKSLEGYAWLPYVIKTGFLQFEQEFKLDSEKIPHRFRQHATIMAKKLAQHNVPVCTTLAVDDIIQKKLFHRSDFVSDKTSRFLPPAYLKRFRAGNEKHLQQFKGGEIYAPFKYELDKMLLNTLHKEGVKVLLSTDAGGMGMGLVPGYSLHRELQILVETGYSPYEAIASGTATASEVVERMIGHNEFGTIEVGKRADMLLVGKNPLLAVENIKDLYGVMASGRWYDQNALQAMLEPGIPITGVVRHVTDKFGQSTTHFEVLINQLFKKSLPDSVDEIQITGPDGPLPLKKSDFRFFSGVRAFWLSIPGPPKIGTYAFKVFSGEKMGLATNTQSVIRHLIPPEASGLSPGDQATLSTAIPTLSWAEMQTPYPLFYRLDIYKGRDRIYSSGYRRDMVSHQVPSGVLQAGQSYRWQVRITDGPDWYSEQNRTLTPFQHFHISRSN